MYNSIYPAKVVDIKDPEMRGRIKVTCAEVLEEEVSAWCEPAYSYAVNFGGDFCLPPLNEWVWVMFQEGDPDMPVYFGGWWSANSTCFGDNYSSLADKVRVINFKDMNIVFNSTDNSIAINVYDEKASKECELKIQPGSVSIMHDGTAVLEVKKGNITINGDVSLKGNLTVDGDALAGNISLKQHIHKYGDSYTQKPE